MATKYEGRRLSTEEICREAAEKLGQMHIRSFRDDSDLCGAVPLHNQEQPPPYYGPLGGGSAVPGGNGVNSPASFLVPPPPPPSPGSALKTSKGQDCPVPSAPPPPPLPPSCSQPPLQMPSTTASPAGYLQVPVDPALSQCSSVGPSPVHIPSFPCPAPYNTAEMPLMMAPDPMSHYPPPTQIPANTTPVMIQPPLPPPPPPLPPSVAENNINNQCTNAEDNVGVNIDGAAVVKEHLYPNYLSFSLVMASLCWLCNITAYICIIPAIICSSVSCSASTYRASKFAGKWALCCNLTALIYGLVTFLVAILPLVLLLSLAAAGYAGLQALGDWLGGSVLDYDDEDYLQ